MAAAHLKAPAVDARNTRTPCGGKKRHETRGHAVIAAQEVSKRECARGQVRPYHCTDCNGWHLTSWDYSADRNRREGRGQ